MTLKVKPLIHHPYLQADLDGGGSVQMCWIRSSNNWDFIGGYSTLIWINILQWNWILDLTRIVFMGRIYLYKKVQYFSIYHYFTQAICNSNILIRGILSIFLEWCIFCPGALWSCVTSWCTFYNSLVELLVFKSVY